MFKNAQDELSNQEHRVFLTQASGAAALALKPYQTTVQIDSTADVAITLPPVADCIGKIFTFRVASLSATYTVTIQDKNDSVGWNDILLKSDEDKLILLSDGFAWHVLFRSETILTVATTPLALTRAAHHNRTIVLTKTDGQALTLPPATGSGTKFRLIIGATVASSATTVKVTLNDTLKGLALGLDGDGVPANAWATAADSDTINLDGSTQGGVVGDEIELIDIAADIWFVRVRIQQSGTEATPFAATVADS